MLMLLLIGSDVSLTSGAHKLDFAEQAASCWGYVYVASDTSAPQHEVSPGGNTKHKYVLFYIAQNQFTQHRLGGHLVLICWPFKITGRLLG